MSRRRRIPNYRHHKPTGQAVVTLDGRDHYLGRFGTPESKQRYDELIAQWLQGRLEPPPPDRDRSVPEPALLVKDVCALYLEHASKAYRKRGGPTPTVERVIRAFGPLRELFGETAAVAFGPKALKAVRQEMIDGEGLGRTTVNTRIAVIKQAWNWAVSEELLPGPAAHALRAVRGLPKGCGLAPERPAIRPVSWNIVEATLPHLAAPLADAVRVQYLGGMRPCEVLAMRACDIDRTGQVPDGPHLPGLWVYNVPAEWNKCAHKGLPRYVLIGPQAQAVLAPYLLRRGPEEYLFSPAEAVRDLHTARADARRTPRYPSHMKRNQAKRKTKPKRSPRDKYDSRVYARAVMRAAKKADVPHWHPNQLRHARASDLRRIAGLDQAGTVLGHAQLGTTQIYAEKDLESAAELIRQVG